mmetsp:Transcript_59196/g.190438  ORF Transcript_59196/g.190438 Transcript_59196/m.190438 type:complete len:292 (+) Transcript_59196:1431-2306(+)
MLLLPSFSMSRRRFGPIFPSSAFRAVQSLAWQATMASVASSLLEMFSTSVSMSESVFSPRFALASCFFSSCTSCCSFFTRLSLSTPVAAFASSLMFFTVEANLSVLKLSSKFATAGLRVPIMAVRELPLRALDSRRVSFELRNLDMSATAALVVARLAGALCASGRSLQVLDGARLFRRSTAALPPPRFWMQVANHMRLRLMKLSSTRRSPLTCVVFSFSRPARSAKYTSELSVMLSPPPFFSMFSLKTVCPRELCAFMAVACTVFMVLPYSMSLTTVSKESTASSLAPLT